MTHTSADWEKPNTEIEQILWDLEIEPEGELNKISVMKATTQLLTLIAEVEREARIDELRKVQRAKVYGIEPYRYLLQWVKARRKQLESTNDKGE